MGVEIRTVIKYFVASDTVLQSSDADSSHSNNTSYQVLKECQIKVPIDGKTSLRVNCKVARNNNDGWVKWYRNDIAVSSAIAVTADIGGAYAAITEDFEDLSQGEKIALYGLSGAAAPAAIHCKEFDLCGDDAPAEWTFES